MEFRNTPTLLAALIGATLIAACGDEAVEPEPLIPTTIAISPASATLQSLADTVRLTATVKNQHGQVMSDAATTWTSSDPATVAVDGSGLVTAVGNGVAEVTARAGSGSGTARMKVDQVPVNVTLDPDSLVFARVGDTARVEAEFVDANGHAIPDPEIQRDAGGRRPPPLADQLRPRRDREQVDHWHVRSARGLVKSELP